MRASLKTKVLEGLLIVGAVAGFGSGLHQCAHHRLAHADALTRACVDAAFGREVAAAEWDGHGHRARWVTERCAAHARQARGS